ncbi:tetraacyldisaccharide 4'-kinase [Denitromonas iodatirespirans]|uniref:Tetraacyldisaccharide 4'-kinase n=1 Tax=Denitromonas iodatirespirans TaxID=2795389 RepID=A0A944H754_DENI1|nr:tetraacyldisaccharide 4'-kinase [Denitromonas iodatirespirans]MBT0960863.1 tetraacyldisaccharide 4'-kinase [Denitromonas iodatirespirans]
MAATAPQFWQRRGWRAIALRPLSLLFALLSAVRRLAYRCGLLARRSAPVPVVVVGNIAVGGSGKTPVVIWLAAQLQAQGFRPGIISRGHGGQVAQARCVVADDTADAVGDEPLLMARRTGCPVAVGRDRPAAAQVLCQQHHEVDVIISDDGLQHYALARTAEIVVIDERVLGNRWLLPAGPLREGIARAAQADLVLAHGPVSAGLTAQLGRVAQAPMTLVGAQFERIGQPGERVDASHFAGRAVHAVAGIGRPQRFFDQLAAMGLTVIPHAFPDHHVFVPADLAFGPGEAILMTEKDAVKCAAFAPDETWVFPVRASIPDAALQPLLETLSRHGRQAA